MKILDLKLTYSCNNDCKYCCQDRSLRKLQTNFSVEKVNEIFEKENNYGEIEKVVLTGGEPTLNDNLEDIVKLISHYQIKNIQLQTNGRRLRDREYLNRLLECGVNGFGISLHGSSAEMHEAFTNTAGSYADVIEALELLKEKQCRVSLNCVLTRHNVNYLNEIVRFIEENSYASSLQFAFIHITGKAESGLKDYVSITQAANAVRALLNERNNKIRITTEAIPLCLMYGCEKHVAELLNNTEVITYDFHTRRSFTKELKHVFKIKFDKCKECIFYDYCDGTWREYPKEFGDDEFIPVKTFRSNYNDV